MAMTVPVAETLAGDQSVIAFTMPRSCDMASLPKPKAPYVNLHKPPERLIAELKFGG